jgi:hypothetical protein
MAYNISSKAGSYSVGQEINLLRYVTSEFVKITILPFLANQPSATKCMTFY